MRRGGLERARDAPINGDFGEKSTIFRISPHSMRMRETIGGRIYRSSSLQAAFMTPRHMPQRLVTIPRESSAVLHLLR